jgi:hypothetical protein
MVDVYTFGTYHDRRDTYRKISIPDGVWKMSNPNGKRIILLLHRVVFFTFCDEKIVQWMHHGSIDHMNRDKQDNRFDNLRYGTQKENIQNIEQPKQP